MNNPSRKCLVCNKVVFVSRTDAQNRAEAIRELRGVDLVPYRSRRCRWWHLTRTAAQRREDEAA